MNYWFRDLEKRLEAMGVMSMNTNHQNKNYIKYIGSYVSDTLILQVIGRLSISTTMSSSSGSKMK